MMSNSATDTDAVKKLQEALAQERAAKEEAENRLRKFQANKPDPPKKPAATKRPKKKVSSDMSEAEAEAAEQNSSSILSQRRITNPGEANQKRKHTTAGDDNKTLDASPGEPLALEHDSDQDPSPPKKARRRQPGKKNVDKPEVPAEVPSQDRIKEHRVNDDGTIDCHVVMFNGEEEWVSRQRAYSLFFDEMPIYIEAYNKTNKKGKLLKKGGWIPPDDKRAHTVVEVVRFLTKPDEPGQFVHCVFDNGHAVHALVTVVRDEFEDVLKKFVQSSGMEWDETRNEYV